MSRFDTSSSGEITREDFARLTDRLSSLKQDALDFIDWKKFEEYVFDKELLDKIWREVDVDNKGEIAANRVNELYVKLVSRYFEQLLKIQNNSNKLPFNNIIDLHNFGVIQTASSIIESHCTQNIMKIQNYRYKFKKEDFMSLPDKFRQSRKNIHDSINNATVSLSSINFHELSNVLTSQVLNAIWSKFDDGEGKIGIDQVRSVIRELLRKYFVKVGLMNVSQNLDDSRMKRYIDDITNTIIDQIHESTPNNDGSITKEQFIQFISKMHGVKTLNKFVEVGMYLIFSSKF